MSFAFRLLGGAAFAAWAGAAPGVAQMADAELRVALQGAMLAHIDALLLDGGYTYLDRTADEMRTVYPANVHPMVVALGEDYFVCSEMVTAEGEAVTADFLVRRIDGEWRVVQTLINDRASLEAALQKAG